MDFVTFVKTHIGQDVNAIAAFFEKQIGDVAAEMGHDWAASKGKVAFHTDGTRYDTKHGIVGQEKADEHRIYMWPKCETFRRTHYNQQFDFPVITFANTRQSYLSGKTAKTQQGQEMGTALFNSLPLLFDEYNQFKETGEVKKASTGPSQSNAERVQQIEAKNAERQAKIDANQKREHDWYFSLPLFNTKDADGSFVYQSQYLQGKGVEAIARKTDLRCGTDKHGFFIAFGLYNESREWIAMQRIYDTPFNAEGKRKKFTWGVNPNGAFYLIGPDPDAPNSDDSVYLCEGLATGLSMLAAKGRLVAIALYGANLPLVNEVLARQLPQHKRVCVADNDTQNNAKSGNAGIKLAIAAIQQHGGFVFIPRAVGGGGDANDVHRQRGLTELQRQLGSSAHYIIQREAIHFDGAFCWLKK